MTAVTTIPPSVDCQISAHDHCSDLTWDERGVEQVTCPCPCHEGTDPADVEPPELGLGDLVRQCVIATNELRDVAYERERGRATAEEHAHARWRVAETRRMAEEALEAAVGAQGQGSLFGSEQVR